MHVYTYGEKAKARKSGPSLLGKVEALGKDAHVFSFGVYWDPTHRCWRYSVYFPDGDDGEELPDLNDLVGGIEFLNMFSLTTKEVDQCVG
jgi:hypothetical protein